MLNKRVLSVRRLVSGCLACILTLVLCKGNASPPIDLVTFPDIDHFLLVLVNLDDETACLEEMVMTVNYSVEVMKEKDVFEAYRGTMGNIRRWPNRVRLHPNHLTGTRVSKDLLSWVYGLAQGDIFRFIYSVQVASMDGEDGCVGFSGEVHSKAIAFD